MELQYLLTRSAFCSEVDIYILDQLEDAISSIAHAGQMAT